MKKRIFSLIFLSIVTMLLVSPASGAQTSPYQQEALEIAALINQYRDQKGLYQLVYNTTIESVAQKHTAYQVSIEESTHYGVGRSTSKDRVEASGYGGDKYIFVSEIIYHGQFATPKAALEWWKNSPIHNEQMTSTQYHEFGVAVDRSEKYIYYTVNFAAIKGVTAPGVGSAPVVPTQRVSAPVTVAQPNADGSIIHIFEEGQTIQAIADAYDVPLDTILLYNGLSEGSGLTAGQIILVKLPVVQAVTVEASQSAPEPTQVPEATQVAEATESAEVTKQPEATATQSEPESPGESEPTQPGGESAEQGSNTMLIVVVAVVVVAAVAFAAFSFLRLRKSVEDEEQEGDSSRGGDRDLDSSDFHHRPRSQQFELLREVAEMALDAYPLDVITIEPLRYALNAEFTVDARPKGGEGDVQQFLMRVNAPGFHSKAEIGSEMAWLEALNQDTDILVPTPVRTANGQWVETVTLAPIGEPRHCVLFRRLAGQPAQAQVDPGHLQKIGAAVAKMHEHGAHFDQPGGFSRKHWDLEGLKGGMLDVPARKAYAALSEDERKVLEAAEKITTAAIEKLGRNDQVYGLIHGDLDLNSFQFLDGQPRILDFDTCGYGYYIYDLAVVVWEVFARDDFASLKTALLHGYRSERQLSDEEEKLLMHFVAARLMTQTLAWAGRRDDPGLAQAANSGIKKQIEQLVMLLRMLIP